MKIGFGYDVHRLEKNRDLILGGIKIPYILGLAGHSDADVLVHAIIDALLGAAGLGDIGRHFPDDNPAYKDADSCMLLAEVKRKLEEKGCRIANIDSTIVAQQPKLAPFIEQMCGKLAGVLDITKDSINIKAKTTEQLGFVGRGQGISAYAVALISKE